MDWDSFLTEYQGRFRKLSDDEIATWPRRVKGLYPSDVIAAFKAIEGQLAESDRRYYPKIWEIERQATAAKRSRLAGYSPAPQEECGLCRDSGYMWFCGNMTGDAQGHTWHLGVYDYNERKRLMGQPYSAVVPCICTKGGAERDGLTAEVVEWRTRELLPLAKRFGIQLDGAIHENGVVAAMVKAWRDDGASSKKELTRQEREGGVPFAPDDDDLDGDDEIPF